MTDELHQADISSNQQNINQTDTQQVTTLSTQMIIREILPSFISRFIFTIHQFISLYFQYNFVFNENPLIFVVIYAGTSIPQSFTVGTWLLYSQISNEALQHDNIEKAEYYNRIAFKISTFWTIVGFFIFYPIDSLIIKLYTVPSILQFQYHITVAIAVTVQTFFEGQALRYGSEDRRLLKSSIFCFYSIVFISFESIIYFFAGAKSTWPTALVFIFTGVMMIVWTSLWNTGYTCFGILNKTIIKTDWKLILSFKNFKAEIKDILMMLILASSLTLLKMGFGVGVLLSVTESMLYGSKLMVSQGELLLVYAYFGQIFRITSLCISEFFIKNTSICISKREHKRLIEIIVKSIIIGFILNGMTILLLMYLPIIQLFVPFIQDLKSAILYAGIGGMCSILNEICLSLSLAKSHTLIIFYLGAMKMVGIVISQYLFHKFLGGEGDFYKISFWGEVSGGITGLTVIICYIISFTAQKKKEEKEKSSLHKKK